MPTGKQVTQKRRQNGPQIPKPAHVTRDDLGKALSERILWPDDLPNHVRWTLEQSGHVAIYAATTQTWRMLNATRNRMPESQSLHVRTIISGPYRNSLAVWVSRKVKA